MKAIWNNQVIAQSGNTVLMEGNHYFPAESVNSACLKESSQRTVCGWKGIASYYHVAVDGKTNHNAAWYYPEPKDAAIQIKGLIAFWKGVEVVQD